MTRDIEVYACCMDDISRWGWGGAPWQWIDGNGSPLFPSTGCWCNRNVRQNICISMPVVNASACTKCVRGQVYN